MVEDASVAIDLSSIAFNFQQAKQAAPYSKVMAVVKANAYGHGAVPVAQCLDAADAFAVARVQEAIELRSAGINHPILLLEGVFDEAGVRQAEQYDLDVALHQPYQLDLLKNTNLKVWLKLETGMHRLGLPADFLKVCARTLPSSRILGVMSHFSDADQPSLEKNANQLETLLTLAAPLGLPVSMANSAGILAGLGTSCDWIRPGIMLYGANPYLDQAVSLRPAMSLTAPVIAIKALRAGDTVGYGSRWQAEQACNVAVLAIGYADGYPRQIQAGTPVWLNGQRERILGRLSMDMMTVSVSSKAQPLIGDRAQLWGKDLAIEEIARQADSLPYVLMCGLGPRVTRTYPAPSTASHEL
jgi:alanine racemase